MVISRRQFLKTSMVAVPAAAAMPAVFSRAVAAAIHEQPSNAAPMGNRTLVIVQMAGGNDGLNTIVPANDSRYYELRGSLAIPQGDVLAIDGQAGFHPGLTAFKELWDEGVLAVVEGVGYPDQSFSHFESMDIWQTAQTGRKDYEGWIGRYLEGIAAGQEDAFLALVADKRMPRAMVTPDVAVPLVESVDAYQLQDDPRNAWNRQARTRALLELYASAPGATRFGALLDNTLQAAQRSADAVQRAHARYEPAVEYGESALAQGLRLIAEAIDAGLGLRVGHVRIGGFDTHAAQDAMHAGLLAETADAMLAFYRDLQAHGHANDVVMMTWSEFGRRRDRQRQRRHRPRLRRAHVRGRRSGGWRSLRRASRPRLARQEQPPVHDGLPAGVRLGAGGLAGRAVAGRARRPLRAPVAVRPGGGPVATPAVSGPSPRAQDGPARSGARGRRSSGLRSPSARPPV